MSAPLPPYDPSGICPKCGSEQIGTTYHPAPVLDARARWPCWPTSVVPVSPPGPHLCRRCSNCNYGWCELPLDGYAPSQWQDQEA